MKRLFWTQVIAALLAALAASPASAAFGIKDTEVSFTDALGNPSLQAGSHPFAMATRFEMNSVLDGKGNEIPDGAVKDLAVNLPPGFAGDPMAVPRCSAADFVTRESGRPACPDATALGISAVKFDFSPLPVNSPAYLHVPVYSLVPPPGVAMRFGFVVLNVPVTVDVGLNPSPPYNVQARATNIAQIALFYASILTVWGDPGSPAHDSIRGKCLDHEAVSGPDEPISVKDPVTKEDKRCPGEAGKRKAFLTLPRSCTGPLLTDFSVLAWNTGETDTDAALTEPGMVDCPKLGFEPRISARPTTDRAESPSGLEFNLQIDDEGLTNPKEGATAQSDVKKAVVTLPEGVTINPSQAEGLAVCSEDQLARETVTSEFGAGCPPASKIGTVEVESPLLEGEVLRGSLFVAEPYRNRFGSLLAIYQVIKSRKFGVVVRLAGKVEPDPRTGQLITTFDDLPQLPFSDFRLRFREGGRSPLVTPPLCGSYETKAVFTPWANPNIVHTTTSTFQITGGVGTEPCPPAAAPPFIPGFEAGTLNNNAASHSPFLMRLTRRDGDQDLTRFDATLPPGVTAKLAGVSRCPDAAIAASKAKTGKQERANPSCPASARIGGVMAGAGVGSQLTYVPGSIYLAGPFGGAPLSVVGVVPAVAGPFDVGTVVTRQALSLDPVTAQPKVDGAKSDPIPHILAGIPLRVRDIQVSVDRPEFALNPTNCDPSASVADIWGGGTDLFSTADDRPVSRSARFQAANCASLGFKPKLSLRLKGGTRRGAHPALRAELTARPGDANIGKTVVTLAHSSFLEQSHIRTVCTRVQFAADSCPPGSIYGRARAFTPLLDEPLEGPVYMRSSSNPLPDLVVALHGIVDVDLVGRIDSVNASIRSSFDRVPDAPVTKFVLEMQGGKKGLIVNSRDLCAHKSKATASFTGQNGKDHEFRPVIKASCGKQGKGRTAKKRSR